MASAFVFMQLSKEFTNWISKVEELTYIIITEIYVSHSTSYDNHPVANQQ